MGLFYKLEAFEKRLYSRTHFIVVLNIINNSGQVISTLSFCQLAGSEKLTSKSSTNVAKTRDSIYIQNSFANLINCISILKSPDFDHNKIKEIPFDDSTLTHCLKNYIINHFTKFRVIGCINPNTGYYESVKETLMFLFKCKKAIYDKTSLKNELKSPEIKRDEVLYELENKIKAQEKNINKLNDTIIQMTKKIEQNELNYKKNLDLIKTAFAFDGDINKLTLNDEY